MACDGFIKVSFIIICSCYKYVRSLSITVWVLNFGLKLVVGVHHFRNYHIQVNFQYLVPNLSLCSDDNSILRIHSFFFNINTFIAVVNWKTTKSLGVDIHLQCPCNSFDQILTPSGNKHGRAQSASFSTWHRSFTFGFELLHKFSALPINEYFELFSLRVIL